MESVVFRGREMRAVLVVLVMVTAGFAFMFQVPGASAAAAPGEIVIGLQNDMTDMNSWNPATNTVWKFYQIGALNFETLLGTDLNGNLFPWLADPARGGGAGYAVVTPSFGTDAATVDVFIRPGVTFTDGMPMTADDVVFSFQTQGWGTSSSSINEALWWDAPIWNHWTGGGAKSHIGVEKIGTDIVRFHLSKTYALFFFATLQLSVMPKHIWTAHIDPNPPLNYTSLTKITDSADRSIDFAFGRLATEISATIGTGPWKLVSWVRNSGSRIVVSDTYWGKGRADAGVTTGGVRYNFYPDNLRAIRFAVYTSLDVISLALQAGDIDTLIWSLLPGFLSQIRFNPAISVEQVTDSGMFYISFNLRRKPWNDLDLRKAISMAIDKDYIVNTLMGGFGIKGTVPHSIVRPEYFNASAAPPSFDLAGARAFLDSVGIVDRNGDGFREYKDGTPIRTAILTPPKDYDPVRADAGIMISNNLKKIGLNIDSAPTSFDTIVAKAFLPPVDFDIYILGFLLGTLPEGYLKDFFHTTQDVNINPAGSNSAGYKNPVVDALLDTMLVTLDNARRTQIVKDIVGLVVNDIPWNILYYRKNLNAYRNDRWVGWVNTPPQIYNFWSLTKLSRPGPRVLPPPSGAIQVALTVPERAIGGRTVPVDVFASQNLVPVSGASVWVNVTFGNTTRALQGTTDVAGRVALSLTVPVIQGDLTLKATAVKGGSSGTTTKFLLVTVGPPAPISTLRLSTVKPVIGVGGSTTVIATVIDSAGAPIAGRTVSVDTTLVLGTIAPASGVTDAAGTVLFTYTARTNASLFPNQHLSEFLKFRTSVTDTVATDTQAASMVIYVENDNAPDWLIVDIEATDLVLATSVAGDSTTIGVRVRDFAGAARAGVVVEVVLPANAAGNVTLSPATATTDAAGLASFTATKAGTAVRGNVPLRFRALGTAFQTSDVAGLLVSDLVTAGYAALIDFSDRSITSSPAQPTTVTATVWDQVGAPATNAAVIFQISAGAVGLQAQFPWAFNYTAGKYLGQGLDLAYFDFGGSYGPSFQNSTGQGAAYGADNAVNDWELLGYKNSVTTNPIDSCAPAGHAPTPGDPTRRDPWPAGFNGVYYVNASGALTQTINPAPHTGDSGVQVRAFIGSTNPASRLHLRILACSGDPATFFGWGVGDTSLPGVGNALFVVDSGFVVRRAPVFALGSVSIGATGEIFTSQARTQTATATFYARDGAVAANAKVFLLRGFGTAARNVRGAFGGTITTDVNGTATQTVTVPLLSLSQAHFFSFLAADPRYAYGGRNQLLAGDYYGDYYLNQFLYVLLAKIPLEFVRGYMFIPTTVAFASATVDKTLVAAGGSATATVTVRTGTDAPVPNATVWSGAIQVITDANGTARIPFSASLGATENLAVVQTPDGQILRAWYGVLASAPVLTYGTITVTPAQVGQVSKVSIPVTNALAVAGSATVTLVVDGVAVASQVIAIDASATKTVTFDHVFDTAGTRTVAIGTQSTTAVIPAVPPPPLDVLAIGLLVVGLVAGAVVGIVLGRRRKPTAAEGSMMEEELKPPEGRP